MTSISMQHPDTLATSAVRRAVNVFLATDRRASLTLLRVILGLVMLPHGLQKTIGLFGGNGFQGTMGWFASMGIPAVLGFLAIAAESAGALALVSGFATRLAAFGILANMVVAVTMHKANGFFMNWFGNQKGEGYEYHLLAIVIAAVLMIEGAGRFSLDRLITRRGN